MELHTGNDLLGRQLGMDDSDWEDGSISEFDCHRSEEPYKEFTVEFSGTPDSAKRKPVRRATAEEKVNIPHL